MVEPRVRLGASRCSPPRGASPDPRPAASDARRRAQSGVRGARSGRSREKIKPRVAPGGRRGGRRVFGAGERIDRGARTPRRERVPYARADTHADGVGRTRRVFVFVVVFVVQVSRANARAVPERARHRPSVDPAVRPDVTAPTGAWRRERLLGRRRTQKAQKAQTVRGGRRRARLVPGQDAPRLRPADGCVVERHQATRQAVRGGRPEVQSGALLRGEKRRAREANRGVLRARFDARRGRGGGSVPLARRRNRGGRFRTSRRSSRTSLRGGNVRRRDGFRRTRSRPRRRASAPRGRVSARLHRERAGVRRRVRLFI